MKIVEGILKLDPPEEVIRKILEVVHSQKFGGSSQKGVGNNRWAFNS